MNPLTVLANIKAGGADNLARVLTGIDQAQGDNFAMRLSEDRLTHSARWAIITDPATLPRLLFASEFDGDLDPYLDALADQTPQLEEIWGRCEGFTDREHFKSFIRANAYPTQAFYIAFRNETVASIRRKIAVRLELEAALDRLSPDLRQIVAVLASLPAVVGSWRRLQDTLSTTYRSFQRGWLNLALAIIKPLSQLGQTTRYSRVASEGWDALTPRAEALANIDGQMITISTIRSSRYWRVRLVLQPGFRLNAP